MVDFRQLESDCSHDGIQKIVVGAIITLDQLTLFLKRRGDDFMGGLVELPSGTVDPGESIDKALKREVFEETGLIITSIDSYINHFDYLSNSGKITRQLNFYVRTQNKEVHLEVSEHSEFYWLEKTNLIKYNISQETKDSVIKALAII